MQIEAVQARTRISDAYDKGRKAMSEEMQVLWGRDKLMGEPRESLVLLRCFVKSKNEHFVFCKHFTSMEVNSSGLLRSPSEAAIHHRHTVRLDTVDLLPRVYGAADIEGHSS